MTLASSYKRLRLIWLVIGIAFIAFAFFPIFGYRLRLGIQGFEPMDLWSGGLIRPITPGTEKFLQWGKSYTFPGFIASVIALLYSFGLGIVGLLKNDMRSITMGVLGSIISVIGGYLYFELNLIIVGV